MNKLTTYSSVNKRFYAKGIVDYRVIIFVLIYACIIYQVLDAFNISIFYTIYIIVLSMIPLLGIYFTVSKEENIVEILMNIFRYLLRTKNYIYKYDNKKQILKSINLSRIYNVVKINKR